MTFKALSFFLSDVKGPTVVKSLGRKLAESHFSLCSGSPPAKTKSVAFLASQTWLSLWKEENSDSVLSQAPELQEDTSP